MKVVNSLLLRIGVVALTAPVFFVVPAHAQSASSNSVLEIQQLQQEIAELRDMLERQQYQIRQLQRQLQTGSSNISRATPTSPQSQVSQTQVIAPSNVSGAEPVRTNSASPALGGYPAGVSDPAIQVPAEQATVGLSDPYGAQTATQQPAPVAQNQEDFYRPYNSDGSLANANPEVVSAARQARQASDVYPPVVDRSFGAPGQNSAPSETSVNSGQMNSNSSSASGFPVAGAATAAGASAVGTPTVGAQPGVGQQTAVQNFPSQGQPQAATTGAQAGVQQRPQQSGVIQVPNSGANAEQPAGGAINAAAQPVPPVVVSESDLYQQGFDLLKQFKYDDAVAVFEQQLEQYPDGSYADDANYWIAESMYLNRNLSESKKYFRTIIDDFAQSPRVPDAMLKTAYIEQDQGNEIEARILLQEIIQYHPRSDAAISAKNRLEKLQ